MSPTEKKPRFFLSSSVGFSFVVKDSPRKGLQLQELEICHVEASGVPFLSSAQCANTLRRPHTATSCRRWLLAEKTVRVGGHIWYPVDLKHLCFICSAGLGLSPLLIETANSEQKATMLALQFFTFPVRNQIRVFAEKRMPKL